MNKYFSCFWFVFSCVLDFVGFDFCEKKWPPKIDFRLVVLMSVNVVVAIQPYRRDDGLGMNGIQMPPLFIGTDAR